MAISPRMAITRPSALRTSRSRPSAPMAYAATHLEARASAEQEADDGHRDPERAAPAPPPGPDGREERVGGDDEQADVDIVHPDPRLDEEHPFEHREQGDEARHEPALEEDAGEQVQADRHERPGDHPGQPPGERVRTGLDRGRPAVGAEDEELLAVVGRVLRLDVERPGRGLEVGWEACVGVDRVGVGLDDVDRPPVGGGRIRPGRRIGPPEDVDLLRGVVVRHPGARPRQRMPAADRDGAVLGRLASDRHDLVGGIVRRAAGHVQLRVVDAEHVGEAVGAAVHPDRRRQTGRGRVDERDAVAGRDRHPRQVDDLDPGQAPVRDGGFDGFLRVSSPPGPPRTTVAPGDASARRAA